MCFTEVVWPGETICRGGELSLEDICLDIYLHHVPDVFCSLIATLVCCCWITNLFLWPPLYHQNALECHFTVEYRMPTGFYVLFFASVKLIFTSSSENKQNVKCLIE